MTKNSLRFSLVVLGLAFSSCTAAYGLAFKRLPEVDPSLTIGGLTLLAGALAILRVRRKK
jgi:LPXTG-motif cell wall-anchored protein